MSLLQLFTDFFNSFFKKSSPEVQKKQLLKKLDAELKTYNPIILKNGFLQPNLGEAIYTLYRNTKPLDDLFASTVSPNNLPRRQRFEAQLILTGYSPDEQEKLASLSYEARKNEVLSENNNPDRIYLRQRKLLETLLKELNTENFARMDKDILLLRQFVDFCRFSFVPFLQAFDTNFIPADFSYKPTYAEFPISKAVNLLEDLYYQTFNLRITTSLADQVIALVQLRNGDYISEAEKKMYLGYLKKINFILLKVIPTERLKTLIRYAREDLNYEPSVCSYSGSPRQEFTNMLQSNYDAEEQRIKSEIQNDQISSDVKALFGDEPLDNLFGYNADADELLKTNTSLSFKWILPMKIVKSFLKLFMTEGIKSLLNDLVIEGFFNNPSYKTDFSSKVYSAINAESKIQEFEAYFGPDQPYSIALLQSYIQDGKKDKDFYRKLELLVDEANNGAHKIMQEITTTIHSLSVDLEELLADAKKPSSEVITNLKTLMLSSRNRDNTNLLEEQFPSWNIYFEIMKNYVIINNGEI